MAIDPNDIDAVQKSVNDASGQVRALWISFLTLMAYLAIAAGSVTHRMLFEETPIKLPILNVDLPLVGFFIIAPFFFVVFHFYLLLQTVTLAKNVSLYNETLFSAVPDVADRDKMRRRLDSFVIVQMLAGASGERKQINVQLIGGVALITMVILPVVILLQIDLVFLPYHNAWVTWFHRILLVADFLLLWVLWPTIKHVEHGVRFRRPSFSSLAHYCSVIVILVAVLIATFPGEPIHRFVTDHIYPVSDALFGGSVGGTKGTPDRLFSNILILADQRFVDDEKLGKSERTISVRGRDLRGAIFARADLRKADFTGSNLTSAVFDNAKLSEARFGCAEKPDANVADKSIYGPRRDTDTKQPPHRWPQDRCTWLLAASFVASELQGADFYKAHLQSALFAKAKLQGAQLDNAELHGASFFGANLDGASLKSATLYGASFNSAKLRGASLAGAELQGASLFNAQLDGATLAGANVYRVMQWPKSVEYAELTNLNYYAPLGADKLEEWSKSQVADLPSSIGSHVEQRLSSLRPNEEEDKKFVVTQVRWDEARAKAQTGPAFESAFAGFVIRLACKTEYARFVAPGLIRNGRLGTAGSSLPNVIAALKDAKNCLGTDGLTPREIAKLEDILANSRPAASGL